MDKAYSFPPPPRGERREQQWVKHQEPNKSKINKSEINIPHMREERGYKLSVISYRHDLIPFTLHLKPYTFYLK